ncbi:MAG: basic amino acid ABC transporter substrate-binding protein [Solirubrobacteraceae bacterium]
MRHGSVRAGVLLAAVVLGLGACGGDDTSDGTSPRSGVDLIKDGEITTCTHLPYRPFQFEQGGKIVGFDVDMIDLVAKKLGVRQSIVDTPFEGIQSGEDLNARKCDIAAAAMTITPEREQKIAFSAPYFDADQALLVKKGSGITSLRDLKGRTLGVQSGTTGKLYAEKNAPDGVQLKDYEDLALELSSVMSGQIPAAVNDIPVLLDYVKQNPELEVAAQFETGEQYGFAMKKGASQKLEQTVNDTIRQAKSDGTYDRIYKKWFGANPE